MKYVNLLLVLAVVLCYGFSGGIYYPCTTTIINCHGSQQDEPSNTETLAKSYKNIDLTDQEISVCHQALLNASYDYDFSPFLGLITVNIPSLEVNKVSGFPLSITTKREYRPPDLFLTNSSFLL
jgi:hypothetical protein